MKRLPHGLITLALLLGLAFNAYSQTAAPTPTPSVKPKRSFDQFDVRDGVRVSPSPGERTSPSNDRFTVYSTGRPEPEKVDPVTYASMMRMSKYAFSIEESYRSPVSGDLADTALRRKLDTLYRIIEIHRVGLLEQKPLQNSWNQSLLKDSQRIIEDIFETISLVQGSDAGCTGELKRICRTYSSPPADGNDHRVEKRKLLSSMLLAVKINFAALAGNVVHDQ